MTHSVTENPAQRGLVRGESPGMGRSLLSIATEIHEEGENARDGRGTHYLPRRHCLA